MAAAQRKTDFQVKHVELDSRPQIIGNNKKKRPPQW